MNRLALVPLLGLGFNTLASEPIFLVAIRESGDMVRIDVTTGAGTQLGGSGVACGGAIGYRGSQVLIGGYDYILAVGAAEPHMGHILTLDRWIGSIWGSTATTGVPAGHRPGGLATLYGEYFCIFQSEDPTAPDLLGRLAYGGTSWSIVGSTGRTDLTCCIGWLNGTLLALGSENGGGLYAINSMTGAATFIGGGTFEGDVRALAWGPNEQLYCCGANLRSVDRLTGQTTLIGPTGFSDLSALTVIPQDVCRAECDGSAGTPLLTGNDFLCFMYRFAFGDPWANCDESTVAPILNANDFICYVNAFAGQCR